MRVVVDFSNTYRDVTVSRDGRRIAYFAGASTLEKYLFVRELDKIEGTPIVEARGHFGPFMSPNGEGVGFVDESDYYNEKGVRLGRTTCNHLPRWRSAPGRELGTG